MNIGNVWPLMGKNCQQILVYPKMSTIFSKIAHKQPLHACVFLHSCTSIFLPSLIHLNLHKKGGAHSSSSDENRNLSRNKHLIDFGSVCKLEKIWQNQLKKLHIGGVEGLWHAPPPLPMLIRAKVKFWWYKIPIFYIRFIQSTQLISKTPASG